MTTIASRLEEVKVKIAQKCTIDSSFCDALLADVHGTIEDQYGLEAGSLAELDIQVVVEAESTLVVSIGADISEMELSDEQLDQVAGGAFCTATLTEAVLGTAALSPAPFPAQTAGRRW